jgi:tRNA C32,U32 (ribose-2'-O)-methylase TrmJ
LLALPEAAGKMLKHLAEERESGRVALLFGSEKTGLSNEELSHCNWLLTIPMHEHPELRHPSMNLGQAVAVCLYELVRQGGMELATTLSRGPSPASAAEVERVALLLNELLEAAGYKRHHPANCEVEDIRRLVVRMGLTTTDAPVWMGMLRQLLWRVSQT